MPSVTKIQNFINGRLVAPDRNEYLDNVNPSTNEIISLVPRSNERDGNRAVQAASDAFEAWSNLTRHERADWLFKIANVIEQNLDALARCETNDMGKPYTLAMMDVQGAAKSARYSAAQALTVTTEARESTTHIAYTQRLPMGVCLSITPWNFPFAIFTGQLVRAISFGNTIVCKPSEMTPSSAYLFAQLLIDIKFPQGVVNIVHGYGPEIGMPIVKNPTVQAVSFTGGTATGRLITTECGKLLKKVHCELGGKNPTVVFNDCDIQNNIETIAMASFFNSGQVCLAGSRLFVQEGIYDKLMPALVNVVKQIFSNSTTMSPLSEECFMGPVVSKQHLSKIERYIDIARQDGGKFLLGGTRPKQFKDNRCRNGAFFMPTIITGLDYTSRCGQEEIFGPVVTVFKFKDTKELLKMVNSVSYGLWGSVFTQDIQKGLNTARKIMSGSVNINEWIGAFDERSPFGGLKQSGYGGPEHGRYNVEFWTQPKNITCKL